MGRRKRKNNNNNKEVGEKTMPYINKIERSNYNGYIKNISNLIRLNPQDDKKGHLNYIITKLLLDTEPKRYSDFNDLIGILECAKLELYRHVIGKYEDIKIIENGDI